jgi:hypothetical protein
MKSKSSFAKFEILNFVAYALQPLRPFLFLSTLLNEYTIFKSSRTPVVVIGQK